MNRAISFLRECQESVTPIVNLIRLPIARYKLRTLDPLCPADVMTGLILSISDMERGK